MNVWLDEKKRTVLSVPKFFLNNWIFGIIELIKWILGWATESTVTYLHSTEQQ